MSPSKAMGWLLKFVRTRNFSCDGGHFCMLDELQVSVGGGLWVEDFGILCGLDAVDAAEALCLEAYECSVVAW